MLAHAHTNAPLPLHPSYKKLEFSRPHSLRDAHTNGYCFHSISGTQRGKRAVTSSKIVIVEASCTNIYLAFPTDEREGRGRERKNEVRTLEYLSRLHPLPHQAALYVGSS